MARFRRTKDELARGITPAQAQTERSIHRGIEDAKAGRISQKRGNGEIILRIRPRKGVCNEYFDLLPLKEVILEEDEHFYKWLDHYLSKVYADAGQVKFFTDLLDQGIGGLVTNIHFERDITWERDNSSNQAS